MESVGSDFTQNSSCSLTPTWVTYFWHTHIMSMWLSCTQWTLSWRFQGLQPFILSDRGHRSARDLKNSTKQGCKTTDREGDVGIYRCFILTVLSRSHYELWFVCSEGNLGCLCLQISHLMFFFVATDVFKWWLLVLNVLWWLKPIFAPQAPDLIGWFSQNDSRRPYFLLDHEQ